MHRSNDQRYSIPRPHDVASRPLSDTMMALSIGAGPRVGLPIGATAVQSSGDGSKPSMWILLRHVAD